MRTGPNVAPLMGGILLVAILGVPLKAWAGCDKDTDCKGDRICSYGLCQDPNPAPQQLAPAVPPTPPPSAAPPVYAPPAPPSYYPPPRIYAPPPPDYYPPPIYAHPRPFFPHDSYATSFLALGGVGYLPGGQANFGGASLEEVWLIPMLHGPGVNGGLTFQLGGDIAFDGSNQNGLAVLNAGWFGMGFDLGITHYLQFGPRVAVGYAYGTVGDFQSSLDGILLVGGHINLWATRSFGFYFEPDAVYDFSHPQWFPRIGGGFAFRW